MAYPNLLPGQLSDELDLAKQFGIQPLEIVEGMDEENVRQVASKLSGREWLYVVMLDGRMILIPSEVGPDRTTHTMASRGLHVIAAGQVRFGADGKALVWDHMSGHYRPHERQAWEVADAIVTLVKLKSA